MGTDPTGLASRGHVSPPAGEGADLWGRQPCPALSWPHWATDPDMRVEWAACFWILGSVWGGGGAGPLLRPVDTCCEHRRASPGPGASASEPLVRPRLSAVPGLSPPPRPLLQVRARASARKARPPTPARLPRPCDRALRPASLCTLGTRSPTPCERAGRVSEGRGLTCAPRLLRGLCCGAWKRAPPATREPGPLSPRVRG